MLYQLCWRFCLFNSLGGDNTHTSKYIYTEVMDASLLDDLEQQSSRRRIRPRVVIDKSVRLHDTLDNLTLIDTEPNTYETPTTRCRINVTAPYSRAGSTRYVCITIRTLYY